MKEITNKEIKEILKELFDRVGQKYSSDKIKVKNWNLNYTWTEDEKNSFKEWLLVYAFDTMNIFDDLLVPNYVTKDNIHQCIPNLIKTNQLRSKKGKGWVLDEFFRDVKNFMNTYTWKVK